MDTSENYIKMCACKEITNAWRSRENQFLHSTKIEGQSVFIWLPRQDEIQEMMKETFNSSFYSMGWIRNIVDWMNRQGKYAHQFKDSMEQLWLAFYMWEKYKKTWNGEKWEDKK